MCTICTTQKGVEIARYNGVTTCYNGVTIEKKNMDHHADEATAFRQYMLLGPPMSFFEYAGSVAVAAPPKLWTPPPTRRATVPSLSMQADSGT